MNNLNKIFGVVLFLVFSLFNLSLESLAITENQNQKNILVLSDRVEQANAKYFVYPQISELVASEIINRLNMDGSIKAPVLSDVRSELRSEELVRSSYRLLNNYRYTYDVDYSSLRKIAKHFNADNVLLVTGSLDTTSDFLKPTWWSFLNVPGENVVKSEFIIYTYMALVDLNSETITWHNVYERKLEAPEFGMSNLNYSPDSKQLNKVKKGAFLIAKDAVYRIESVLTPSAVEGKTPPTVHEMLKMKINKKYEESVQNINAVKDKTVQKIKDAKMSKTKDLEDDSELYLKEFQMIDSILLEDNVKDTDVDAQNLKKDNEKEAILNFVNSEKEESLKEEELNKKVKEVIEEKAVKLEPEKVLPEMDLRPAIETEKNIKINPINIIIPKM